MLSDADAVKLLAYEGYLRFVIHAHLAGSSSRPRSGYTSDVLQDAFAKLQSSPRNFDEFQTSQLVGYARQTAINTALNLLRHLRMRLRHIRSAPATEGETAVQADGNPICMADLHELLDEEEFLVLSLRAHGYTHAEISEQLHWTLSTTWRKYATAVQKARGALS